MFIIGITLVPYFVFAQPKILDVPFSSQAPYQDWSQPWYDACEEAVIMMIDYYYNNKTLNKEIARDEILRIFERKNARFGETLDESTERMVWMIEDMYNWTARQVKNPSIDDIKNEIDNGRPVIIPAYGRGLGNIYFKTPGPVYHVFIISGYDDSAREFITNEPGTYRGLHYRYSYETVMNALHDWRHDRNIELGEKIAIFTTPPVNSLLIKTPFNPKVYYVFNGVKYHILNESVFLANGWRWSDIQLASETYINELTNGRTINSTQLPN